MSSAGSIQPPPAAVTGTTSTLTDSVFLSGSGSSRKDLTCNSALRLVPRSYSLQFDYRSSLHNGYQQRRHILRFSCYKTH